MLKDVRSFESLERRDLLATDLLAGLADFGGTLSSRPQSIVSNGVTTYFDAQVDGSASRKVFVTNGTSASTKPIFDGQLDDALLLDGSLYFLNNGSLYVARNGAVETLLTYEAGFNAPSPSGPSGQLVQLDANRLLWIGDSKIGESVASPKAWVVDDTCVNSEACSLVREFDWPFDNSEITLLGAGNGRAWFQEQSLIWSTDGNRKFVHRPSTPALLDVGPYLTASDAIYFAASPDDGTGRNALWSLKTNSAGAIPEIVRSVENLGDFTSNNGFLIYSAKHPAQGQELYVYSASDREIRTFDLMPGEAGSYPEYLTPFRSGVAFSAANAIYYLDLEGGDTEPTKLSEFDGPAKLNGPEHLTVWNDHVYFVADNGDGAEIWRTDGTVDGTKQVVDLAPGPQSSFPQGLTPARESLFFSARTAEVGFELWRMETNGDVGLVKDIRTEEFRLPPVVRELTEFRGETYFSFNGGGLGVELWKTDGTPEGTQIVKDIFPGERGSSPRNLFVYEDHLYFSANDGQHGYEVWRSDGTKQVVDLAPGPLSSFPQGLTPAPESLLFSARTAEVGFELWRMETNGDVRLVKDIRTEEFRLPPVVRELTEFRGETYFSFNGGGLGVELWKTDGTPEGTQIVKDIFPGERGSSPRNLFVYEDHLYFSANDGQHGYEVWRSDGTNAGTHLVADVWPGPEHSSPSSFSVVGEVLVFGAYDGVGIGGNIWRTFGTPESTVVYRELEEEAAALLEPIEYILGAGNSLFIVASNGTLGQIRDDQFINRSQMRAWAEPVVQDDAFFIYPGLGASTGFYRITDTTFDLVSRVGGIEGIPSSQLLTKFGDKVYFIDGNGSGVRYALASGESMPSSLPAGGIVATDTHLFSIDHGGRSLTLYAIDKHGDVELLVDEAGLSPVSTFTDDRGITLAVNGKDSIEVWYSDGTRLGSRVVEELDAGTEIREATRIGDRLLVVQARPDGTETLLSLSLELNGDVTQDGRLDATDIDAMYAAIASNETDTRFDLNQDSMVDQADVELLVTRDLATNFGDLDLDGRVSFADFLVLSQNFGKQDASYDSGDVNGDGEVGFSDFLLLSESFGK